MYNIKRLSEITRQGLDDLWPAMVQAFNQDTTDDRLHHVYGPKPTITIALMAVFCVAVGQWFAMFGPSLPYKAHISWPAVAVGLVFSIVIRYYLFRSGKALKEDFPWLAASLTPAFILAVITTVIVDSLTQSASDSSGTIVGNILVILTNALGTTAALTIAVATLCFSRNWVQALMDLAIRLLVFKIMVWVTVLILLEIGIVGPIISRMFQAITGISFAPWVVELADQITYASLMGLIYLAVIGSTWTVCRRSFSQLLETGHVDILKAVEKLVEKPKKKKAKESQ